MNGMATEWGLARYRRVRDHLSIDAVPVTVHAAASATAPVCDPQGGRVRLDRLHGIAIVGDEDVTCGACLRIARGY